MHRTEMDKLIEMNKSLIADNNYLREQLNRMSPWIDSSRAMPRHGQLVVKFFERWASVWAGIHTDDAKHGSFDKWVALPYVPK